MKKMAYITVYRKVQIDGTPSVVQSTAKIKLDEFLANHPRHQRAGLIWDTTSRLAVHVDEDVHGGIENLVVTEPLRCFFSISQKLTKRRRVTTISGDVSPLFIATFAAPILVKRFANVFEELITHHEDRVVAILNNLP